MYMERDLHLEREGSNQTLGQRKVNVYKSFLQFTLPFLVLSRPNPMLWDRYLQLLNSLGVKSDLSLSLPLPLSFSFSLSLCVVCM